MKRAEVRSFSRSARVVLNSLLVFIERLMAVASRVDPVFRSSITRDVVFEISTDDGIARHCRFDGVNRRVASYRGHAERPDSAMRFTTASAALRTLLSTDPGAADKAIAAGEMRIEGSASLALWFSGLAERATMVGRWRVRRRALPEPYLEPDPASRAARFITVEPPEHELDPSWKAAWEQRAKLALVRGSDGEPPREY
jgi:hypothetical protein